MSVITKLEVNVEQVKRFIREIDHQLASFPDDITLAMSRESMVNHLMELEQKMTKMEIESDFVAV